jgi:hypothetical protein
MRDLIILFIHAIATLMRVTRPGGVRGPLLQNPLSLNINC